MRHLNYIVVSVIVLTSVMWAANPIIEDGHLAYGVPGVVRKIEDVDVWKFIPERAIEAGEKTWPAEEPLSLLPCSVLEQVVGLAGKDNEIEVRLWGLFTRYHLNNYLYSVFFMPVQESGETVITEPNALQPQTDHKEQKEQEDAEQEDSIIPLDILENIRDNKTPDLQKFQQVAVVTGDENLIGRTGYLKQTGRVWYFQPNGFGQNVNTHQYMLLPSSAREDVEKLMQKSPGRQRYKVSGLVTRYKGHNYILLRRAVRTYTHGNFTP